MKPLTIFFVQERKRNWILCFPLILIIFPVSLFYIYILIHIYGKMWNGKLMGIENFVVYKTF